MFHLDEIGKHGFVDNYELVQDMELENKGLLHTFATKGI
jgi:hypothetical protein